MIWKIAIVIIAIYLFSAVFPAIVGGIAVFSRKKGTPLTDTDLDKGVFAPYKEKIINNFAFFDNLEKRRIDILSDDAKLYADYVDIGSSKVVIFFHGYRSVPLNNFFAMAKDFYDEGYNIVLTWGRGHSPSEGKNITVGLKEQYDVLSWIDYFDKQDSISEIVVAGSSMGCGAIEYASDKIKSDKVKTLICDCGYTSVYNQIKNDMKKRHIPYFLIMPYMSIYAKLVLKLDIEQKTAESLKNNKIPTVFLHGKSDETVPVSQGIENYEACNSKKLLLLVDNAYHTQAYVAGGEEIKSKLFKFINTGDEK